MGIVEIVGYAGDGEISCVECLQRAYEQEKCTSDTEYVPKMFRQWLYDSGYSAVTDQEDFGPEGYRCSCGQEIQVSYCPECGTATGLGGDPCDSCHDSAGDEVEEVDDRQLSFESMD